MVLFMGDEVVLVVFETWPGDLWETDRGAVFVSKIFWVSAFPSLSICLSFLAERLAFDLIASTETVDYFQWIG